MPRSVTGSAGASPSQRIVGPGVDLPHAEKHENVQKFTIGKIFQLKWGHALCSTEFVDAVQDSAAAGTLVAAPTNEAQFPKTTRGGPPRGTESPEFSRPARRLRSPPLPVMI